ncbi:hypothetical protein [Clostridium sp. 'White wine YQ']|uniref:hypothetical protein n=1 Tax=Clostridium sp. 'White wine YQ' TaxID=3027474 RepID=UPI002366A132|nr:hypothetical protein [Clostridium sp. 'White wine YQ']MDD7796306.1 hypothetical protein [Clostridium sp. 'White wine YQ']
MRLNNIYNFKNPIKHFVNIDTVMFPEDISSFNKIEIDRTYPINFRIRKKDDKYRVLKLPNILNFRRAYEEFKNLDNFEFIQGMDEGFKRLSANTDTGDFVEGEYERQLEEDFERLSVYDNMIKIDIKEFYGRIYTHYLGLGREKENFLTNMNLGATNGLIMGNYISLYFAELYLTKISDDLKRELSSSIGSECDFSYFSDDFYFFCNRKYNKKIINIFDKVLERYQLERNDSKEEIWTYETFNNYNMVARYWKKVIAHSNTRFKKYTDDTNREIKRNNKLYFINQLVYRMSKLQDDKLKKVFINNFFKTRFFRDLESDKYQIKNYDYHQLCFLFKTSPECLLYCIDKFLQLQGFDKNKIRKFFIVRYKESLKEPFNDEQLYYYYAIKKLGFNEVLRETTDLVINSENQILISYYLKERLFSNEKVEFLSQKSDEKYWFQNYHLILYTDNLKGDLDNSIKTYLIPSILEEVTRPEKKESKMKRYFNFYKENLSSDIELIRSIGEVNEAIKYYLDLKIEESEANFESIQEI